MRGETVTGETGQGTTETGHAGRTALIAGAGGLAAQVLGAMQAAGAPRPLVAAVAGFAPDGLTPDMELRIEHLGSVLADLRAAGVTRVCLAGAVRRPRLDPAAVDAATAPILARLMPALQAGDDATLRAVLAEFETAGLAVVGADALAPELVPGPGVLAGAPDAQAGADAARAAAIVAALGAVDVGQGAVVAQGLCLGVETLGGTDALLAQVAALAPGLRPHPAARAGLLFKAPKPGQDRRVDLPAIGPATVRHAAEAGLAGIAWQAGGVLLLDRAAAVAEARRRGLFLWAWPS